MPLVFIQCLDPVTSLLTAIQTLYSYRFQSHNEVGQKSSGEEALMRQSQMKVLRSLERATMYVVEIVVKKAIMLEAAANLKI
jgi:hypothetical protein